MREREIGREGEREGGRENEREGEEEEETEIKEREIVCRERWARKGKKSELKMEGKKRKRRR